MGGGSQAKFNYKRLWENLIMEVKGYWIEIYLIIEQNQPVNSDLIHPSLPLQATDYFTRRPNLPMCDAHRHVGSPV